MLPRASARRGLYGTTCLDVPAGTSCVDRQPFDRHIQRLHDHGAGLGRQAAGEDERAIVVVAEADFAALLLAALARQLLGFLAAAIRAHEPLDVSRGAVLGDHQQVVLIAGLPMRVISRALE